MRLKQFLETFPDNEYLFLGASDGNAWMLVETGRNMKGSLSGMSRSLLRKAQKQLAGREGKVRTCEEYVKDAEKRLQKERNAKDAKVSTIDWAERKLKQERQKLDAAIDSVREMQEYIDAWVPLGKREVVEVYEKITEPFGYAVLVRGTEKGKFWSLEEALEAKREEDA